jgi:hypothetical protein
MPRESAPRPPADELQQEEKLKQERPSGIFALPEDFLVYYDQRTTKGEGLPEKEERELLEFLLTLNPRFFEFFKKLYPMIEGGGETFIERLTFFKDQYTMPMESNEEAIEALMTLKHETKKTAENKIKSWREYATDQGRPKETPLLSLTRAGFTLKETAPTIKADDPKKTPLTYKNFKYLQNWQLQNDAPTKDALVFFTPRLAPQTTDRNVDEQQERLEAIKTQYKLPENHLTTLGDASLLIALILAHYKRTEQNGNPERIPLGFEWTRTDTCSENGTRLDLGNFHSERGLSCLWFWDEDQPGDIGVFGLGVEELEH